jgi:hypothetical protein
MPAVVKRVARAVVAAVASTDAVKAERSLAALIVVRVLLSLGASVGIVDIVSKIIGA